MMIGPALTEASRRLAAALLGGVVLWQVAENAGPSDCQAVIHVTEADVEVRVDGKLRPTEIRLFSPLVCDLRSGRHTLTMSRGGRLLYEETFHVPPGGQVILTAHDPTRHSTSDGSLPSTPIRADRARRKAEVRGGPVDSPSPGPVGPSRRP